MCVYILIIILKKKFPSFKLRNHLIYTHSESESEGVFSFLPVSLLIVNYECETGEAMHLTRKIELAESSGRSRI